MYKIEIAPRAKKELRNLTIQYRQNIAEVIEELKENPAIGKPLSRNLTGKFVYKLGIYRIIYKVSKENEKVSILTVGHRSTVY